jgi:tripartite-type tricarboxylate transporter receptor subunit TctC
VSAELFKMMAGVNMVHVPYRGAAHALSDLLAAQVQVPIDNVPTSIEHVRAGRVRGLAVTSAWRSDLLPTVPAFAEFVPGYEATSFFGIGAPRGTPVEIVELLNAEIKDRASRCKVQRAYHRSGCHRVRKCAPPNLAGTSPARPTRGARWRSSRA